MNFENLQENNIQQQEDSPSKSGLQRRVSDLSETPHPQLRYSYSGMSNTSSNNDFPLYSNPSSCQQFDKIRFIKDEELFSSIREKLSRLYIEMMIDEELILYLLYTYKWNLEKMRQRYYDHDSQTYREKHTALNINKQAALKMGTCPICYNGAQLCSNMLCDHLACKSCWTQYIHQKLMQGSVFFCCMNEEPCRKCPLLKIFVDKIAPSLSQLYRKKICVNYAIQDKNVSYCPTQRCPYFCEKSLTMEIDTVACPCGTIYCFKCSYQPHAPLYCGDVKKWESLLNNDENNKSWIKENTRTCPNCKNQIQKKVGCSRIKCICNCQFCFECNSLWDEIHSLPGSQCPLRQKKTARNKEKQPQIIKLNDKLTNIMSEAAKDMLTINKCFNFVCDEMVKVRLTQTKKFVLQAWLLLKWSLVSIYLVRGKSIEHQFEDQYVSSIGNLMQPIEVISKHLNMPIKQLNHLGQQALVRRQCFKKVRSIWLQAYTSVISYELTPTYAI